MKKSWHPSTFQNLERVWKAESKHDSEQKKIAQLQQELREEQAREEMQRTAEDTGVVKKRDHRVEWLYSTVGATANREEYLLGKRVDKHVDPLLQDQERESQALESGPGALFVAADGAGLAADISVKVREDPLFLIRQREEEAKKKLASNPIKLKQLAELVSKEKKGRKHKKSKKHRKRHSSSSDEEESRDQSHDRSRDQWRERSPIRSSHRRRSPDARGQHQSRPRPAAPPPRRLDPAEMERRRQEMMDSAREHGTARERRLRRHEEERKREDSESKTRHKQDFLQPLRVQSLTSSESVGERIHRKINTVQRTNAELTANFMRK